MSQKETILRHRIIIQKLRNKPSSFEEILEKLESESDLHQYELQFEISKRTFQRDIKEIASLYNIVIKFDRGQKVYFIAEDHQDEYSERMFEALDVYQILNLNHSLAEFIQFDTRKPEGTEHLSGLLYAIQNRFQIQFRYAKFWSTEVENRTVEPYLLKEVRKRWYVFAYDLDRKEFRTFGLDRLFALNITQKKFQFPQQLNPKNYFKDCFGIIGPDERKTENILLKFTENQGSYIRTLPLHSSQKILEDRNGEMTVQLKLIPTYDFVMELLSHGEFVKVLEPADLVKEIKTRLQKNLKIYE
ncbi:MAG: WYL domain-containing protein [Weeksellaceae bacterium]|jgi:predicted DNA-binding transcriptional regulator YafY|nr:WYL domain-containing protein [Weeksellaceae bacterium]MDX9705194.1 WYL domain-containing protein [Weeksellaceae bacterium]